MQPTLTQALRQAYSALAPHSEILGADAQLLLAHILGRPRPWIIAHSDTYLTADQNASLITACLHLSDGMPLPYILGQREFFGLEFTVTPGVLIPRPETEHLVEAALTWLDAHPTTDRAIDIGTGSGCIAIALAASRPRLQMIASDISTTALHVASINVERHDLAARVLLVRADLLPPLVPQPPLICANLPYIPSATLANLPIYRREPNLALDGGSDGMNPIRNLLQQASSTLPPGGRLLLEIEASQGPHIVELASRAFLGARIQLHPDLAGHDRLVIIDR